MLKLFDVRYLKESYVMKKLFFLFLLLATPVIAESPDNKTTHLTFTESVEKEVEQDRIKATLLFQSEGVDASHVQQEINNAVASFVKKVKRDKQLDVYTGRYHVRERWNNRLKDKDGWQGEQIVYLESENKTIVLELVKKAQSEGFLSKGLSYFLSKEAKNAEHDDLIRKALELVQRRATLVQNQLNKEKSHISTVEVVYDESLGSGLFSESSSSARYTMAATTAPVVESKKEAVGVTVKAEILLFDE